MFIVLPLFIFVVGLCVGSFVNVVILRFGFGETNQSRSHCMACATQIRWYDLLPVVSFTLLRGRCRVCGSALSRQYPLVEGAVGFLFLLTFISMPPVLSLWSVVAFVAFLVFLAALVALVAYDIRHTLVPLPFIYVLAASAFFAALAQSLSAHSLEPLFESILGGGGLFLFFFCIIAVTRGKGMGMGDAYVAACAGLLLGLWRGIEAVMLGVWSATAIYLLILLLSSLFSKTRLLPSSFRVTMKTELPFVPFLALGILLALFTNISPLLAGTWLTNALWFH